jgi:methionyl aminopeptidase
MIEIKTPAEIEIMSQGGKILSLIMKELEKKVKPGITTEQLDKAAEGLVLKYKAKCSFKGYQGFPACLCVSINQEIVHGLPSKRVLKQGDIVSLDLGVFYKGFHTDMAITLPVGQISSQAEKLIKVTKTALLIAINKVKPGNFIGDIENAIQEYVEKQNFNVVRELCGHGIGREVHQLPQILNYGKKKTGDLIKPGMVLCIEPMVTVGHWKLEKLADGFGFRTKDDSLSCHFEQTIALTEKGCQVLTK